MSKETWPDDPQQGQSVIWPNPCWINRKAAPLLLAVSILCIGCRSNSSGSTQPFKTGVAPANAYSLFLGVTKPAKVPSGVNELQAAGAMWLDMHILCRFHAPDAAIDSMIAKGYQRTNWEAVVTAMHPVNYTNFFAPAWNPDGIRIKECYLQGIERDHCTDMLYLAVDRQTGFVYAVAESKDHD
jgi:hypothetical protein